MVKIIILYGFRTYMFACDNLYRAIFSVFGLNAAPVEFQNVIDHAMCFACDCVDDMLIFRLEIIGVKAVGLKKF